MRLDSRIWRPLTACVVAYAFALFAILTSFAPFPAAAAIEAGGLSLEICHHDGADPVIPADPSDTGGHCKFCVGNAHAVAALPPGPHPIVVAYACTLRWVLHREDIAPLPADFSAQPRGPPIPA